jgi:hypothetical protein
MDQPLIAPRNEWKVLILIGIGILGLGVYLSILGYLFVVPHSNGLNPSLMQFLRYSIVFIGIGAVMVTYGFWSHLRPKS